MHRGAFRSLFLLSIVATPLSAQSYAGAPGAGAMTGFGMSLAVGDGEVFVGEPNNNFRPGQVYVYRKTGTTWRQATTINAPDSGLGDRFGASLAVGGTTLFVGSTRGTGAVYVFRKEGSAWKGTGTLTAADLATGDGFGATIAASGDWLLVSAPLQGAAIAGTLNGRTGAVYFFHRGGNGEWTQAAKIAVPDPKANDGFGASIALSGSRALVGAPGKNNRQGIAYVYQLDSAGTWQEAGRIARTNAQANDVLGSIVRLLQDDAALVGAPTHDGGYGAVFVFRLDPRRHQWTERGRITGTGNPRNERFPSSVAVSGSQVWIGSANSLPAGHLFTFTTDTARMPGDRRPLAGSDVLTDRFGQVIALNGNLGAVAALGADAGGGSVAIYERSAAGDWRAANQLLSTVDVLPAITGGERKCSPDGTVSIFACKAADLRGFLPTNRITTQGRNSHLSGMWGWTDPETNREIALIGRTDGTAFVDVTDPTNPVFLGDLPMTKGTFRNSWREIKTYKNYALIISEGPGHGMQVFDLTQLRKAPARTGGKPMAYAPTVTYDKVGSVHGVVVNEESGFAYLVGSGQSDCNAALHMVDMHDPTHPAYAGCFADSLSGRSRNGYIHDAQCVMYRGPDSRYAGREVCIAAAETGISIQDVTDKAHAKVISRASHTNVGYAHQGWFTEDQKYWYMDDELDEVGGNAPLTRTIIWDLTDLEKPTFTEFQGTTAASDHNLYIVGNTMYQSNYQAGLRILDITDRLKPVEVGYFDTAPYEDNVAGFGGSWSNYPFFKSGTIVVSSANEGVFMIKKAEGLTP
ncbi:MAG: choice-of-anchor B family protein [Gemmatimonadetes bacterium]|nr:choice-of-anchor B family protein [Gemmatimonadota bacterium]